MDRSAPRSARAGAVLLVAGVHALLGYALLRGLAPDALAGAGEALKLFTVAPQPPPLPVPPPRPRAARRPAVAPAGGSPGAVSRAIRPVPIVRAAPAPLVPTLVPPPFASGGGLAGGAGGSGVGGSGTGEGAGDGAGAGGGGYTGAVQIAGSFRRSDFPRSAREAGRVSVDVEYAIGTDGRVNRCDVLRSSGHADVDAIACRVILERYRFEPARDASGDPVVEVQQETETWWMEGRG